MLIISVCTQILWKIIKTYIVDDSNYLGEGKMGWNQQFKGLKCHSNVVINTHPCNGHTLRLSINTSDYILFYILVCVVVTCTF